MKTMRVAFAAIALLAGTSLALAADTPPPAGKPGAMPMAHDCSKAPNPAQCEERREKMRAAAEEAKKACEGKQGDERRACMTETMCAKAPDPQRCQQRAESRKEARREAMKECADKRGDERRACMREHRPAAPKAAQ